MVKKYKFFKTVKKTAMENDLAVADGKILVDFSLLDYTELLDKEKEVIKDYIEVNADILYLDNVCLYDKTFNQFEYCHGNLGYVKHRVYNKKTGRLLYIIFQIVAIKHTRYERTSVYDGYKETVVKCGSVYTEPIFDIEI